MRNPRVGDVLTGVVLKVRQNKSPGITGLVGTFILTTVLDGVAINQGNFIIARVGNDIAVGGVAQCGVAFDVVGRQVVIVRCIALGIQL